MANHGVGTKFVSVNLNKSYGQPSHHHHHAPHPGSYGASRGRPGSYGSGGMVVLSRPRSANKSGPKLSVPPPLNLPSLRKEHERFDSSGSGGGAAGGGASGGGSRPSSSGVGWTKPAAPSALQEKDEAGDVGGDGNDQTLRGVDVVSRGNNVGSSVYMPPSARSGPVGPLPTASALAYQPAERALLLRGEDFPSLQAALPSSSGPSQKQKDGLNQKLRQAARDESLNEHRDSSNSSFLVDMRPQLQTSRRGVGNGLGENGIESKGLDDNRASEQPRKQDEYFPGPLPLVRLNPRSDWADDERDTSHGFTDRGRDHVFSNTEPFWDRDFDMPRLSVPPHKLVHNPSERRGLRDNETGKVSSSEVPKVDQYSRDARTPSREGREGNSWRTTTLQKDAISGQVGNDRSGFGARPTSLTRETSAENKYSLTTVQENAQDGFVRRDVGYRQGGRQPWNNSMESYASRGAEWNKRDRYSSEHHNRYRGDSLQNNSVSKPSYSLGGKGLSVNDPLLNFGRDKRAFSKSEKPYVEDPFMKDFGGAGFDSRDPFSSGLFGVVKKKKDVVKQSDFHDPVRESFEAELERVQKMQEQERQRIIEEHERALELARREEEERIRLTREHEERQRRLEEETREAAWRAEQEQLEAMQRAEEQRLAREEEKRRLFMEEERRKHAAKQKLLELEERIAKRKAESGNTGAAADEKLSRMEKEKEDFRAADMSDWEDGERMVERITASASSDSSLNRSFEMGSGPHYSRDSSAFVDRGKPVNSWRRDVYENGNSSALLLQDQDNGHLSPRRDSVGGRAHLRKEFPGGGGFMPSRAYNKGGIAEPNLDDITHLRGQRWNLPGDGDHYSRNLEIESEFHDNLVEKFNDVGWGQGRVHGHAYSPYPEQLYPNSDADGPYSFGRSRYSVRQPRVLPPPPLASMHKTSYRGEIDRPGPSAFLENQMQYNHGARSESTVQTGYDADHPENIRQPEMIDVKHENTGNEERKLDSNTTLRCDSQSSLSVSSPPNSPTHLSHDDLDESRDSSMLSTPGDNKDVPSTGQESEPLVLPINPGKENVMNISSSVSNGDDEEWAVENNEHLQEQEEYDEDEDGYEEEDEVHEGDDENIGLTQDFEDMHLVEKGSSDMMDNLVLGFNEGVEVGMPNDEFERISRNEEGTFEAPQVSSGTAEEQGSFGGIHSDEQILQPMDGSSQANSGYRMLQETEKAVPNLVIEPNSVSLMSASTERVDHVDASSSSGPSSQYPVASSVSLTSHLLSGQAVMPAVSAVSNQTEGPVKLQFGLFSGPSLIPSPVPAIQIGSIQMPLPLHPQVGPLAHLHPSQPPLFQFGQLRYTSPISQGLLPLAPQSMSFVQPNAPSSFSMNQSQGVPLSIQTGQGTSQITKNDVMSRSIDIQTGPSSRHLDASQESGSGKVNSVSAGENTDKIVMMHRGATVPRVADSSSRSQSVFQTEDHRHHNSVGKNVGGFFGARESERQAQTGAAPSHSVVEKDFSGPKAHGPASGGRGKKFMFTVKNSGPRSFPAAEPTHIESNGFQRRPRRNMQRTEFRVRQSADKRQSPGLISSNHVGLEEKYVSGRGLGPYVRGGPRRVVTSNKAPKELSDSEGVSLGPISSQEIESGSRADKGAGKSPLTDGHNISQSGEGNLKRNIHSEEDVYAPMQSGVVRVFEQPGIEAPSDEDDFIEVRSKRQMLNDRREQREKEIKAKSRALKVPRKPRSTSKTSTASANSGKYCSVTNGKAGNSIHSDFFVYEGRGLTNIEVSAGFNTTVGSQPLAPIGTPAMKIDAQADIRSQAVRSHHTSSIPLVSGSMKNIGRGSIVENKNKVLDNDQASMGSWSNSRINQQVMALTQTQLDDAMKPGQFGSHPSVGEITSSVCESSMPSSSILTKDKSFSSANPINSLLAGEKIQFGAVTSPTILPPSSRSVSVGIGPPGPSRSDMQLSDNLSVAENDRGLLFEKDKRTAESCAHLEDCEAEAAASAVAVAAISSDDIVGNGLGACSASVADTKSFGGADIDGITTAGAGDQQLASQSRTKQSLNVSLPADLSVETSTISQRPHLPGGAGDQQSQSRVEESLSVSLPADLSVETPPISLWPPLPSPQNSSSQMLPHFTGGPPSHFPFYEMNPMLGGPVFAFGPHDESASTTQPQSQKSNAPASAPLGTWQQCHSGVDSFYGPPAGFTGPFISPAGGIPGVQGPPHMVVYNHFAPVGQFGQVGLSFMGTAYIPSGKQPDWKHNPTSSAMGEGEMNNISMVSAQRNPSNMPAPIQHLAPGSPLVPMASPLAMFDVSPFQSSPDMSAQTRWPHVPASPLQSVPLSMPLQGDGILPSKFSQGPADESLPPNRFPESRTSAPFDNSRNFPVVTDATVTRFPDELRLVDPGSSCSTGASSQTVVTKSSSVNTTSDTSKAEVDQNFSASVSEQNTSSNAKSQSSMHKNNMSNQHYGHSSYYQRGGPSQRNSSGGDWPHRRMGFQGRNQSAGADKNFSASKMKQIYVAKQTASSGSSTAS